MRAALLTVKRDGVTMPACLGAPGMLNMLLYPNIINTVHHATWDTADIYLSGSHTNSCDHVDIMCRLQASDCR